MTNFLFVYGSLRPGFTHSTMGQQFRKLLDETAAHVGEARISGTLFDVGKYPAACQTEDQDAFVVGDIFEIKSDQSENVIETLDAYEDYDARKDSGVYRRRLVDAICNGDVISAWVYMYYGSTEGLSPISDGDYLTYLRDGES